MAYESRQFQTTTPATPPAATDPLVDNTSLGDVQAVKLLDPTAGSTTPLIGQKARTGSMPVALATEDAALFGALATETTVAAILAKIITSPMTEATGAAILAKLIAAPATEATTAALLASLGATTDAAAAGDGSAIALLKQLRTLYAGGLPASLGQKAKAASLAVVLASDSDPLAVTGTFYQATQPISAASLPLPSGAATSAAQTTGNTSLSSIDGKLPALASGRVPVDGSGVTQPVSGTVAVSGVVDVTPASPAAGDYLPVRLTDGASFYNASGGGGGAGTEYTEGDTDATITGTAILWEDTSDTLRAVSAAKPLPIGDAGGSITVDGTFWQATQPVSAASLPLPSGAATAANQATANSSLASIDTKVDALTTPSDTQPISAASLPLPTGAATAANQTAGNTSLASLDTKAPALGQALAAASVPVVLPAAQITTLTPPAAITGFATETTLAAQSAKLPATLGQKTKANSLAVVLASDQDALAVTGTFWQATQPVSAASLPLPSGAATAAKQPALGTAGSASADVITVQGIAGGTAQPVSGSVSVSNLPSDPTTGTAQSTTNTRIGDVTETAPASDTASSGLNGRLQRIAQRLSSQIALLPTSLGQKTKAASLAVTLASDQDALPITDNSGSITVDNGGTFAVQAAQSGTWNVTNVSGTVSLPTGAATAAKQPALGTAGSASADVLTVQGIASGTALAVSLASLPALASGSNNIGDVDVLTLPALPAGTNNIGDVDVLTLPALPTGANVIGGVTQSGTWTVQPGNTANTTPWLVKAKRAATPTQSSVAGSASSVTLLASNANRLGATIYNDSAAALYLKLGATTSTTSFTIKMATDGYYEVPYDYTDVIDGIWASATGNARITEVA